jgi:uncharacterized protein YcbK (DUF882 family)
LIDWGSVQYFRSSEFACQCGCGKNDIQPVLVYTLDELREAYGKPMTVTSGYRCPAHNQAVSSTGEAGPHTTGLAVDIACSGRDAWTILRLAMASGKWTGIGVQQKSNGRYLHLDMIPDSLSHRRPWVWSY